MFLSLGLELLQVLSSFLYFIKKPLNKTIEITHTRAGPRLTKMTNHLGFRTANYELCQMTLSTCQLIS